MIRDGLTKMYSQVKPLNDSSKMVPDNQPVTEWFQLSSPSTWGWESDGGKCMFFSMCMMEMRWMERECMDRERQRQMSMHTQVHRERAISPKKDNIVRDDELRSHHEMKMNLTLCLH